MGTVRISIVLEAFRRFLASENFTQTSASISSSVPRALPAIVFLAVVSLTAFRCPPCAAQAAAKHPVAGPQSQQAPLLKTLASGNASVAPSYTYTELYGLDQVVYPTGINNFGQVVGNNWQGLGVYFYNNGTYTFIYPKVSTGVSAGRAIP